MKKVLALMLAMSMAFCLAACGGNSTVDNGSNNSFNDSSNDALTDESGNSSGDSSNDESGDGPTDEQLQKLTDTYNEVAILYNEVATAATENGWLADAQVASDIQAIGDTLEPIGIALSSDLSALYGADFDALPDALLEFMPTLEALAETVAQPYDGESAAVVTDEALIPVANALNEVVPIFNEVYEAAEANGWLEDPQTAEELQTIMGTLTFTQSGLTDDPSKLENVTDFDALADAILQLAPALEEIAARVSVPYEG